MPRRVIVAILVVVFCLSLVSPGVADQSSAGHRYTWARSFGGQNADFAWTAQQDTDNGYIIGGWTESFGAGAADLLLVKLDASGSVVWQKTYGGNANEAADLILTTADGYVVVGYTGSFGAGGLDVWFLKLDKAGSVVWQKTYGGTSDDEAISVLLADDGGFAIAGETKSFGAGDWDVWVIKLDRDGNVQWQKTYGGPAKDTASADPFQQTPDGGYVLVGRTASFGAGESDAWVLKLDALGAIEWERTFGGPEHDEAHAVRIARDGSYVVAGFTESFGAGGVDTWLLKLDADGSVQWQKTYGGSRDDLTWTVGDTFDGGAIVGGTTESFGGGGSDLMLLKLDANGDIQWQKTYGGNRNDEANSVRQTTDGGFIVVGGTVVANRWDYWALKLDVEGSIADCSYMRVPNVTVTDTNAPGVASEATVSNSEATTTNSNATAKDAQATARMQCAATQEVTLHYLPVIAKS